MYKNVFIAIDLDDPDSWTKALPTAAALARANDAHLILGTIVPDAIAAREAQWSPAAYRELLDLARARLAELGDQCGHAPHAIMVGGGSIGRGILDLADEAGADLIVLASHRPGLKDYLIGANAVHVVRHAPCSVLVVRG